MSPISTVNRTEPKLGSIGVVNTGDGFVPTGIRWATARRHDGRWENAKVNHAVVYLGTEIPEYYTEFTKNLDPALRGQPLIVEAEPHGAKLSHWDAYGDNIIWIENPSTRGNDGLGGIVYDANDLHDADRWRIAYNALRLVDRPYSYRGIAAIAMGQARFRSEQSMAHYLASPPWWVKRLVDPTDLFCSQLADLAYENAGINLFQDGRLPGLVSPQDLYELLPTAEAATQLTALRRTTK